MRLHRTSMAVQVAIVAISLLGCGVARAQVTLGASLGYTHTSFPEAPGFASNVIGMPSKEVWGQPGFRVGYFGSGMRWGVNVDLGLDRYSSQIGTETTFELLPQVEVSGPGRNGYSPFVNGGVGIEHEALLSLDSTSEYRPAFGGGIGVRKSVSDGHGSVRVELRYDYLPKVDPDASGVFFLARHMVSVKLGFDLLVAR